MTAEFSDLAERANGSLLLKYGETVILATAVMGKNEKEGMQYFPLTVDFEERFYAAGEILGSRFVRREGRPTDEAVLSGRVVDRTIRPLFPQWMRRDVQVVITVLSLGEDDADILGVLGASLALATSDIPWAGPVSSVRIGMKNAADLRGTDPSSRAELTTGRGAEGRGKETGAAGKFIVNPTYSERKDFTLDLAVCGRDGNVNMIEVAGKELSEEILVEALRKGSEEIEKLQKFQEKIVKEIGKKKALIVKPETPEELKKLFVKEIEAKMPKFVFAGAGHEQIEIIKDEWMKLAKEALLEAADFADDYFEEELNKLIHKEAIENDKRPDGRGMDDLRPLFAKAGGISPVLHGSGIFYRGGTHIISALTLGGPEDSQLIDSMESRELKKRFMHHYNFPPYSSGETGRLGGMNRRMIGHGALAEKALLPVLPAKEVFPYTIRIVSEAVASNGSTSMGSVCGGSLAMMDGGVPISAPVAGIASGLMMSLNFAKDKKYKILTDIQGPEDHHGDMDFKVAGTRKGVTAVQMDVKVGGIPVDILAEAFEKAKSARLRILDVMEKEISAPRKDISPRAPKILTIKIKKDQIGLVIGTGGKTINEIRDTTGVDGIDIEEDGTVFITGKNGTAEKALEIIESMTHEFKAGEKFIGEVVKITDFGAFVAIGNGGAEGLVHISEIAPFRVASVYDVLKEGDKVPVVVKEIDERDRIKLSIKDADPTFARNLKPKK